MTIKVLRTIKGLDHTYLIINAMVEKIHLLSSTFYVYTCKKLVLIISNCQNKVRLVQTRDKYFPMFGNVLAYHFLIWTL